MTYPPSQAGEPLGSQEFSPEKAGEDSDRGEGPETTPATDDRPDAKEGEQDTAENSYMNDVSEEEEEDEEEGDSEDEDDQLPDVNVNAQQAAEEEDEAASEREDSDAGSDDGKAKLKSTPRATDFEDLEEFFVAGGKLEEAKKRKEW
jgi:hypothetical protein